MIETTTAITYNIWTAVILPVFLIFIAIFVGLIIFLKRKQLHKFLIARSRDLVMLEIRLPKEPTRTEDEPLKSFVEIIGISEQFFSSLSSLHQSGLRAWWYGQPVISFEIVTKNREIMFYVGVPKDLKSLVEKQIHSYYPTAQVEPGQDFRIFQDKMEMSLGIIRTSKSYILPIKTYNDLQSDSLNNIANALSKLGPEGRALIQVLVRPNNGYWRGYTELASRRIQEGQGISHAKSRWGQFLYWAAVHLGDIAKKSDTPPRVTPMQEEALKALNEKASRVGFDVEIKVVTLAPDKQQAESNLQNIFSAYAQFNDPIHNSFHLSRNLRPNDFLMNVILRNFHRKRPSILNTAELASIYHFPTYLTDTPGIRWFLSKRASSPPHLPTEGLVLGKNVFRGEESLVRLKETDRRRHIYALGMTGTGKSTFFESMILQDIKEGKGLAVFDPHGDLIDKLVEKFPKERAEDLILFDPADTGRPLGLNLLEWKTPDQKDFLVQEAIQIFYKLFDPTQQGFIGPQFEHWMRNAALTLMSGQTSGTLIEIPRLFTDDGFRERKISEIEDDVVRAFWTQQMAKTSDFHKSEMYNYFISKFGRFMTNKIIRNIIGQSKSSFDIRDVMDKKKVLLVDLSKGKIGDINSNLLGMIIVAKLFTAALSRQDMPEEKRSDFYVYVDEFQNFATDTFASILSEARKYRLNLSLTNQFIAQLSEPIRDAVIGNVGTLISFRIGMPDAEFVAKEFAPVFDAQDLTQVESFNAYVRLLIDNTPAKPFSMKTIKDETPVNNELATALRQLSRLKYGRDVTIVDREIQARSKIEEIIDSPQPLPREAR